MIQQSKQKQALHAINAVLIQARSMAYEKVDHKDLAYVLDTAEYRPKLMLEERDATSDFREVLVGLAAKFEAFNLALERFDVE